MNIDIDFDVFKALTNKRRSEAMTFNDVLREMLDLPIVPAGRSEGSSQQDWITSGVRFPTGTQFRATYKGKELRAVVKDACLHFNGETYSSLSMAAVSQTNYAVNGWHFWEVLLPGTSTWRSADSFRSAAA